MRCPQIEAKLLGYIGGRLGADEGAKVDEHLEICPRCRRRYQDEVELFAVLRAPVQGLAGEGFAEATLRRIAKAEAQPVARGVEPVRVRWQAVAAMAAALLAVGLALGWAGWPPVAVEAGGPGWERARAAWLAWLEGVAALGRAAAEAGAWIDASWAVTTSAAGGHGTVIAAGTALAMAACAALVAATRKTLSEEMRS